jgi:hypothetical protein
MADHIDEMFVVEFTEKVRLDPIGSLLSSPREIHLECIEFCILASEIDTRIKRKVLGLSALPQKEVNLILIRVLLSLHSIK